MISRVVSLTFIAFMCLCVSPVCAQQLRPTPIYVPDVELHESPEADEQKIAQAVNSLLELRLNAMKDVQVVRGKVQCEQPKVEIAATATPLEEVPAQTAAFNPATYQVKTSIKVVTRTSPSGGRIVESILDYDLLKYVSCKETTVIRRSEPISLRTAFATIVQMGDLLEAAIKDDSTAKKIVVDLIEITGANEFLRLKNQLTGAILSKLVDQDDFQVRNFIERPANGSDYIVTGRFNESLRQVNFVVQSVRSNKSYEFSVPTPVAANNADEAARFFEKSATMVLGYIRSDHSPGNLTDAEVMEIVTRAQTALCMGQAKAPDCVPQPASVIPDLARLRDLNRATPEALSLLGEAYALKEDYQKAVEAYDQAWTRSGKTDLFLLARAGDLAYKGQSYAQAAERYDRLIELSPNSPSPIPLSVYVQAARSYRFAGDHLKALDRSLQGLTKFPNAEDLDKELSSILDSMPDQHLVASNETLARYKGVPIVARRLSDFQATLIDDWAMQVIVSGLSENNSRKVDEYFRLIESLPVSAPAKESHDLYRIARAVWVRDTRFDFAGAIASLERYTNNDTREGMLARFLLAETFYQRARSSSIPNSAEYYGRAAALLKPVVDRFPEKFVLQLLVKTNHELGKDQETRELLEQLAGRPEPVVDAQAALAVLCVDYIGDLVCGERVLKQLGQSARTDRELLLRLASIQIFWAQYRNADELLNSGNSDSERSLLEVELFYSVWLNFALSRAGEAQSFFNLWLSKMESLRRSGQSTDWVFATALRALEAEQALHPGMKDLLKRMIAVMTDKQQPLPPANIRF